MARTTAFTASLLVAVLVVILGLIAPSLAAVKKEEFHIPVVQAASDDDLELLKKLISEGASPNSESKGIVPLHLAIRNLNIEMARYLLSVGADPNIQNPSGENSAHLAIISDNAELTRVILEAEGLDIHAKNPFDYNTLHVAAIRGSLEAVTILKARGYNTWNEQTEYLDTPLHTALKHGRHAVIWFLLALPEINIEIQNDAKWTPFLLAVVDGNLEIVKHLKGMGANDRHRNSDNETALHRAIQHDRNDVARYLVEELDHEIEPVDNYGWTPLHFSVLLGNVDGFDYLIEKGADPTAITGDGIDIVTINERSKRTGEETKQIFREKLVALLPQKTETEASAEAETKPEPKTEL